MQNLTSPLKWVTDTLFGMQWPFVVAAAFYLGRYVKELEHRVRKTQSNIDAIIERHLPAIHRALAEIRGMLQRR